MTAIAILSSVMPALVAGIHALRHRAKKDVDGRGFMREDGASRLSPSHDDRDQKALTKSCPTAANLQGHGFAAFKLTRMFCLGPRSRIILAASLGLLSDPDPNPIGPGLLAFFTFWPAVILIVWGLIASLARFRRAQAQS
jgi:hypothetical protein